MRQALCLTTTLSPPHNLRMAGMPAASCLFSLQGRAAGFMGRQGIGRANDRKRATTCLSPFTCHYTTVGQGDGEQLACGVASFNLYMLRYASAPHSRLRSVTTPLTYAPRATASPHAATL